jgi:hypothetical protein
MTIFVTGRLPDGTHDGIKKMVPFALRTAAHRTPA